MSETTNIGWATSTGNPWIGCTKVSPGCKNCYAAELDAKRFSKTMASEHRMDPHSHWGNGSPRVRTKAFWMDALRWNREAGRMDGMSEKTPVVRPRIFPSLCDWLDDEVPIEWLADFLKLIHDTPNLDWLLLTKRPENFVKRLYAADQCLLERVDSGIVTPLHIVNWHDGQAPSNVWIGVSVEDQKRADERIPLLLQIPAKVRFLSVEPLLSAMDIFSAMPFPPIDGSVKAGRDGRMISWVIVGGESGKDRRDCGVEAIEDVARQCLASGVPCFVKQASAFKPGQRGDISDKIWNLKQFPRSE